MRLTLPFAFSVVLAAPLAWGQTVDRSDTAAMLGWINEARATEGLSPLAADPRLDAVAESHSLDMASHRFFSHTSPTTGAPADRAAAAGLAYRALAENIALNQSPRGAHEALMRSPGHRANLLDGDLRRVGLGIVRGPDGFYVTQYFATFRDESAPAPAVPPPAPVPTPAAAAAPAAAPAAVPAPADETCDASADDACDDTAEVPAPAAAPTPTAPAATPTAPGQDFDLPQVIQALPGWLGLPSWTPVAPSTPSAPASNSRTTTRSAPAAGPAAQPTTVPNRAQQGGFMVPTPFGPIQIGVPEEVSRSGAGQRPTGASPDPGDDTPESVSSATPAAPARRRPAARVAPRRPAYEAPQPPRTTPGRVTSVEVPPIT